MRTFTVAIGIPAKNQQVLFPACLTYQTENESVKIITHSSPVIEVNGLMTLPYTHRNSGTKLNEEKGVILNEIFMDTEYGIEKNFDVLVTSEIKGNYDSEELSFHHGIPFVEKYVKNSIRETKNKQALRISSIVQNLKGKYSKSVLDCFVHTLPLERLSNSIHLGRNELINYTASGKVIVKPLFGARQLSMMVVTVNDSKNNYISVKSLMKLFQVSKDLDEIKNKLEENNIEFTCLEEDRQTSDGHYLNPKDLGIFPYISDIVKEFRVLKFGNKIYFANRDRKVLKEGVEQNDDTKLKQEHVPICIHRRHQFSNEVEFDHDSPVFRLFSEEERKAKNTAFINLFKNIDVLKMIGTVMMVMPIEVGSIDVFVTKEGKVGIFEYSNDFNYDQQYAEEVKAMASTYLVDLYEEYKGELYGKS